LHLSLLCGSQSSPREPRNETQEMRPLFGVIRVTLRSLPSPPGDRREVRGLDQIGTGVDEATARRVTAPRSRAPDSTRVGLPSFGRVSTG